MPFAIGMSGWFYLVAAVVLNAIFIRHAWRIWRHYSDRMAQKAFRFSIVYLSLLFAALLVDHYLPY
jgi:protoheme IX farnesyltransferase